MKKANFPCQGIKLYQGDLGVRKLPNAILTKEIKSVFRKFNYTDIISMWLNLPVKNNYLLRPFS